MGKERERAKTQKSIEIGERNESDWKEKELKDEERRTERGKGRDRVKRKEQGESEREQKPRKSQKFGGKK